MITFHDAFMRRGHCIYAWTELTKLTRGPRPWKLCYIVPAAMAQFKTWGDWEAAVEPHAIGAAVEDDVFEWLGAISLVNPVSIGSPQLALSDPFKSTLAYVPFMLRTYGYKVLCDQLWRCVK